jgi:hypothetical protein
MSEKRLHQRIRAVKTGVAVLNQHKLCFRKPSTLDGSAKCDIQETGQPEDYVLGVLYDIEESQKTILDSIEGLGSGYDLKTVSVSIDGQSVNAYAYYATSFNPKLKPYHWYKKHVLEGAKENRMPADYINSIEAVEAVTDKNDERRRGELSRTQQY